MSASHPVVFRFGGVEHHLTFEEAAAAETRLHEAILAATVQRDRARREEDDAALPPVNWEPESWDNPYPSPAIALRSGDDRLWLTDDETGTDEACDFTGWDPRRLVTYLPDDRAAARERARTPFCKRYGARLVAVYKHAVGGEWTTDKAPVPPVDRSRRCTTGEALAPGVPNTEDRGDGQQRGYVILCDDERAKGFVRPVRRSYKHVGPPGGAGCGTVTTMGQKLAETYARDPSFYSGTFCCGCSTHLPVGADGEFVWGDDGERVGT